MIEKWQALNALHPDANYEIRNGVLDWRSDDIPEPTEEEIQAAVEQINDVEININSTNE